MVLSKKWDKVQEYIHFMNFFLVNFPTDCIIEWQRDILVYMVLSKKWDKVQEYIHFMNFFLVNFPTDCSNEIQKD